MHILFALIKGQKTLVSEKSTGLGKASTCKVQSLHNESIMCLSVKSETTLPGTCSQLSSHPFSCDLKETLNLKNLLWMNAICSWDEVAMDIRFGMLTYWGMLASLHMHGIERNKYLAGWILTSFCFLNS